ncbi:hypothetical protein MKZ38_009478 [Zalerion maritima]|uniref:PD-(D/E)XK nuclease-like domain-containing protein n=1 Tax=Zalerion maritima TaxID=339359 RepID=A0AAD5RGJ2_9PEZI|nr:hypothetical protein MKZ38_009478 [Zalerion maritima]
MGRSNSAKTNQRILTWLSTIDKNYPKPQDNIKTPTPISHRKHFLPSPSLSDQTSMDDAAIPTTPKRPRLANLDDQDATPTVEPPTVRAPVQLRHQSRTGSSPKRYGRKRKAGGVKDDESVSTTTTGTSTSGASSPSKASGIMTTLDLCPEGAEWHPIEPVSQLSSPKLRDFVRVIKRTAGGNGYMPKSFEACIRSASEAAGAAIDFEDFGSHAFVSTAEAEQALSEQPGYLPPLEDVLNIIDRALELQATWDHEAGWSHEVYHPLLASILRHPKASPKPFVDFTVATTASPHPNYIPYGVPSRKVDYFIYFDPSRSHCTTAISPFAIICEAPSVVLDRLDDLRRRTGTATPNPTTFPRLKRAPMVVCVETKKQGAGSHGAELQLGVWHAYQWKFLLAHASSPSALDELAFLPGILIEGHSWSFTASMRQKNGKTAIWSHLPFGRTDSAAGVYRIIAVVRFLAKWVRDTYWPWFAKYILGCDFNK